MMSGLLDELLESSDPKEEEKFDPWSDVPEAYRPAQYRQGRGERNGMSFVGDAFDRTPWSAQVLDGMNIREVPGNGMTYCIGTPALVQSELPVTHVLISGLSIHERILTEGDIGDRLVNPRARMNVPWSQLSYIINRVGELHVVIVPRGEDAKKLKNHSLFLTSMEAEERANLARQQYGLMTFDQEEGAGVDEDEPGEEEE